MTVQAEVAVTWRTVDVTSPRLARPVPVVAAKGIPYRADGNRFQTLNLYLPAAPPTAALVGTRADSLPDNGSASPIPRYYVHVHGGAWRDPQLTATSIEPAVAHIFTDPDPAAPITVIASINYTLSHFPTHPTLPYDIATADHADPAREAVHPGHVSDVLQAFSLLRSLGLTDRSYVLSGHSCGACLAFQAILHGPQAYGLSDVPDAPCPAAIFGLNGLYDLPALVSGLGVSHEHLRNDYKTLLSNAFGTDESRWPAASPARFAPAAIAARLRAGHVPPLIVLDESAEDQLVPMNQLERFEENLSRVEGMQVIRGRRCTGVHAAPWEQGVMIKDSLNDTLEILRKGSRTAMTRASS